LSKLQGGTGPPKPKKKTSKLRHTPSTRQREEKGRRASSLVAPITGRGRKRRAPAQEGAKKKKKGPSTVFASTGEKEKTKNLRTVLPAPADREKRRKRTGFRKSRKGGIPPSLSLKKKKGILVFPGVATEKKDGGNLLGGKSEEKAGTVRMVCWGREKKKTLSETVLCTGEKGKGKGKH